jgi:acetyltransferase-like isoleucine patch superfamily enzyme
MKRLLRFLQLPWHDRLNYLHGVLVEFKTIAYYRRVFGKVGRKCRIHKPLLLSNPRFVYIGDRTLISKGARIETMVLDEATPPFLSIGSNVNIEQNVHLFCSSRVIIGDNVSIAPSCSINDTVHPFLDLDDPRRIGDRIDLNPTPIEIGANSLIGFGCAILSNVHIGRNCIVGANSTVKRDIPDFCVVSGNPASILMRYDFEKRAWI